MRVKGLLLLPLFFSACLGPGANHEEVEPPPVQTETNGSCPGLSRVVRLQPKIAQILATLLTRLDSLNSMSDLNGLKTYGAEKQFQYVVASLAELNQAGELEMSPQKVNAFKNFVAQMLPQYRELVEENNKVLFQCTDGPIDTVDGQAGYGTVPGSLVVKILNSILQSAMWDDLTTGIVHEYTHQISLSPDQNNFVTDHLVIGPFTGFRIGELLGNFIALLMKFDGAYDEFPPQEVGSSIAGNAVPFVDKEVIATEPTKSLQPMVRGQTTQFVVEVKNIAPYAITKVRGATLPSGWSYRNGRYPGDANQPGSWCGVEIAPGARCLVGLSFTSNYTTSFNLIFPIISYPSVKHFTVISSAPLNVIGETVIPIYVHNRLSTPGMDYTLSPAAYNDYEASLHNAPLLHLFTESFGTHTRAAYRCPLGGSSFISVDPACENRGNPTGIFGFFSVGPVTGANYILFCRYSKLIFPILAAYPDGVVDGYNKDFPLGYVPF